MVGQGFPEVRRPFAVGEAHLLGSLGAAEHQDEQEKCVTHGSTSSSESFECRGIL